MDLAAEEGAPHAERWIRNHLSQNEAKILYAVVKHDRSLMLQLKESLPSEATTKVADAGAAFGDKIASIPFFGAAVKPVNKFTGKVAVTNSGAYKFAHKIIDRFWGQEPKPRPVKEVSETLEELLGDPSGSVEQSSHSLHGEIDQLIGQLRPFLFGGTPMRQAVRVSQDIFEKTSEKQRVLCVISDGISSDGDPREIAKYLSDSDKMDVVIATCFLTSDHIEKPKCLIYDPDPSWGRNDGRRVLFEMSSIMKNTHTPISYLVDADWELSLAGESRLFIQANSLDVVNEFCRIVISQMSKHCDALVHVLEKINLADYINVTNAEFMPKQQQGETCYANACAAVLNLAMHRIVDREGGVPSFKELRKKLIAKYGEHGKRSEVVLNEVCPEYRLRVRTVDETGARKAINERRPVVARFSWYVEQYKMFKEFYEIENTPKGILKKENIEGQFLTMHANILSYTYV